MMLQASEILVLHENVGTEIDIIEKEHYGLFPKIKNFISAQFYLMPDGSVIAKVKYWNDNGTQTADIYYTEYEAYRLGQEIGKMEIPDEAEIEFLKKKYQPLFAEENIRQIPMNAYCVLHLNNKEVYHGYFFRLDGQNLQIQYEGRFLDIPIKSIKKMKYWDEGQELKFIKGLTLTGFTALGFVSGQLLFSAVSEPVQYLWFYHATGALIGGIIGYKLMPVIVDKLQPRTVIEFRKNKIKRLDSVGRLTYTFKKLKGRICRNRVDHD